MLDTKYRSGWICCLVSSRFLISEAHSCSIKVPTNLISATWRCYCNQLSAPASLLPSTALLSQRPGQLCFSARSGWVSYSHQRRWQWLERRKSHSGVFSHSWHTENSMPACGHITGKLGHFRDWPVNSTKKVFYQSRYCAGFCFFFLTNKLEGLLGTLLLTMHPHAGEQVTFPLQHRQGNLILAHYSASLISLHSLASLHTISSA